MKFSDFFQLLYKYLANSEEISPTSFLCRVGDDLLREPQTDIEDTLDEDGSLNPLRKVESSTVAKYCNGKRKIPKRTATRFLNSWGTGENFKDSIRYTTPQAREAIYNALVNNGFEVNESKLATFCYRLMCCFFEKLSDGSDEVLPSDMVDINQIREKEALIRYYDLKCPLCGDSLLPNVSGKFIDNYNIVYTFPENLSRIEKESFEKIKKAPDESDAIGSQIPLCVSCANKYLQNPDINTFKRLVEVQAEMISKNTIEQVLQDMQLENQLVTVIEGLTNIEIDSSAIDLAYDAKKIDDKIPDNVVLQFTIKAYVSMYYNWIRERFSQLENGTFMFEILAMQIKTAYLRFKGMGYGREKIFKVLTDFILEKEKLTDRYYEAARIVVAFFVANCEVFEVENAK